MSVEQAIFISEPAIPGLLFLCHCDQMPGENRERKGRFILARGFRGVLHHHYRKGLAVGTVSGAPHIF